MSETPLIGLPLIESSQAQKHVTHNEALMLLDAAIQLSVKSRVVAAPPISPLPGDRYLIALAPVGAWAGHAGELAISEVGAWRFAAPRTGWRLWVEDDAKFLVFDGSTWIDLQAPANLSGITELGVNATADPGNRLSVSSPAVLFNHEGTDHRLKINKNAAADTASLVFQTGFSGRAEMGLAGNDDFQFKVSPDGSSWNAAIDINRTTGAVSFPNTAALGLSDGNRGDVAVAGSGAIWSVERSGGAVGDGVTDDTAALQSVLTAGHTVVLSKLKSYRITSRLSITAPGTGVIGHGARLIMDMGAGAFDNASSSPAVRYDANATGILATGIVRPVVRDLRVVTLAYVDGRYVRPIALRDCDDIEISGCDISGFSCAANLIHVDDCAGGRISGNHIHDCSTNHSALAQITGIGTDMDSGQSGASGRGTSNIVIAGNRVEDLTVGATFLGLFGHQTDGINGGFQSNGLIISGNRISNCGEGIDVYSLDCAIIGNVISGCYNYGLKFLHGASRNVATGNYVKDSGFGGILLAGTSTRNRDTVDNLIANNTVSGVNTLHDHDANSTFGISIRAGGGTTYLPRRNRIWDNLVDLSGTGKSAITAEAGAGTLNDIRRNAVLNYTIEDYNINAVTAPTLEKDVAEANSIRGNNTGAAAIAADLTATQVTAMLNPFSPALKGLAPASGGGTANFLRADGTWAAPGGGGGGSGDVVGPSSSTAAAIARFDGTTGKLLQDSIVTVDADGVMTLPLAANPPSPATNKLSIFGRAVGGRMMLAMEGPSGLDTSFQPHLGRNKVSGWFPLGNAPTINGTGGAFTLTVVGTATAANVATTSRHTYQKRIEYLVTTASASATAGWRIAAAQHTIGAPSDGNGGFHFVNRWGPATGVATATNRAFVGMSSATAAPNDVEPSSITNIVGMGWDAADANVQIMHRGAGAVTKIDLGAGFPVPSVDRTACYELAMFSPPGTTQSVAWEVTDLTTGAVATGTINSNLPTTATLLAPRGWMSVGGTSSVIGIALMSLYIETDY